MTSRQTQPISLSLPLTFIMSISCSTSMIIAFSQNTLISPRGHSLIPPAPRGSALLSQRDDLHNIKSKSGSREKKRRFLQQAHPIVPPTKKQSEQDETSHHSSSKQKRIRPLQNSKSIEELEAILEKRWGTANSKPRRKESSIDFDDDEFVLTFEDDEKGNSRGYSDTESAPTFPRGAALFHSRRVVDPWEREERGVGDDGRVGKEKASRQDVDMESGRRRRKYDRDEAMLKRVRSNQARLMESRSSRKSSGVDNDSSLSEDSIPDERNKRYDDDDEWYEGNSNTGENSSSRLFERKRNLSSASALSRGLFANNVKDRESAYTPASTNNMQKEEKKKPKRKKQEFEPMLDEDGSEMFLTLEQADRIVQNILTTEQPRTDPSHNSNPISNVEWEDIGITNPILLSNLQSSDMVCISPLEVQIKACPAILAGSDSLISTHTGSGKTLAFLAPIAQNILKNPSNSTLPKAIVIAPGRELASQIVSVAQKLFIDTGLTASLAIGGTSYSRNVELIRAKKPDVVVGTPGRIAELVLGRPGDKGGKLRISHLDTIVLDEFDALLQYDIHKEPTLAIMEAMDRQHGQSLQRVLCSATASDMMTPPSGGMSVEQFLRPGYVHASIDESDLLVTSGGKANAREGKQATSTRVSKTTIHGTLHVPHRRLALDAVRRALNTDPVIQQALIFVDSSRRVDIVIEKLAEMDIIAAPLHGGVTSGKEDRAEVSKALREGYVGIVVATELAARGLDAPYLTHVINLDLPTDASHYAHRSGRCGRGGRPGVALSITCSDKEKGVPKRFAEELGITMYNVEAREGKLRIIHS